MLIFSLLLLGINAFSTFNISRTLSERFEAERKTVYARQVQELDGMMRQSSAALLALTDFVPYLSGMEEALAVGNGGSVAQAFERHWRSLQLVASLDAAQIYDTRSELIQSWKSEDVVLRDPAMIRSHVQGVNKTERPVTFLDCNGRCLQFVVAPMLAKGKHVGVIVVGTTLAAGIVGFKDVSGVDIGILNVTHDGSAVNGDADKDIADWGTHVSALTNLEQNLPLLRAVATRQHTLPETGAELREAYGGREYEIHLIPFEKFSMRGNAYFVLIEDITQSLALIQQGIRQDLWVGLLGLILSELLLLLILWRPLSRLRRTAELLPLLAQNAFDKIRQAVTGTSRRVWYRDEFDVLDDTIVAVSQQLENLQTVVARRTAALNEVNQAMGRMNEELERKVQERTKQLNDANIAMQHLNEELELKVKERTGQLLEAQEELVRKEKLAMLGQVAGSVGHELRNPLGVMSNAVYFLQTVLSDADETTREYLNIIKDEINGSERIVSDLLDAVRTKLPNAEVVGVRELIEQTLGRFTVPTAVAINLDVPDAISPVRVDTLQIGRVLGNLISNGLDAMPEGGILEIGAMEDVPAGAIVISVRDTGRGIGPEIMAKLFQPLVTTKARGIGLGLVVAKNLTEANGGKIGVQSVPGKGTTFTVALPMANKTESAGVSANKDQGEAR
ncbi:MAG TPA: cache domain-containing protein [Gallionella sp.]|nr:cache domain-containing protein [Gallionella sp.]